MTRGYAVMHGSLSLQVQVIKDIILLELYV